MHNSNHKPPVTKLSDARTQILVNYQKHSWTQRWTIRQYNVLFFIIFYLYRKDETRLMQETQSLLKRINDLI